MLEKEAWAKLRAHGWTKKFQAGSNVMMENGSGEFAAIADLNTLSYDQRQNVVDLWLKRNPG
ncbi:MAG: hypothetical protein AAFY65_01180 [Pseudomonadota bacterium]